MLEARLENLKEQKLIFLRLNLAEQITSGQAWWMMGRQVLEKNKPRDFLQKNKMEKGLALELLA